MIPSLSFDLTSTLATILTVAKELEATIPKPSIAMPCAMLTTIYSGRIIKRHSGQ
jgi:hypothetical protein